MVEWIRCDNTVLHLASCLHTEVPFIIDLLGTIFWATICKAIWIRIFELSVHMQFGEPFLHSESQHFVAFIMFILHHQLLRQILIDIHLLQFLIGYRFIQIHDLLNLFNRLLFLFQLHSSLLPESATLVLLHHQ